ncbi:cyclin-dependent protein serine/threonine kinase [Aureococcus anophagefferens]|nr:cyclin-dependent protein serine/threonine kinase [Aureococcus anophagefferens]
MRPLRALLVLAAVAGAARRRGKTCVLTISCLYNFAHVLSFFEAARSANPQIDCWAWAIADRPEFYAGASPLLTAEARDAVAALRRALPAYATAVTLDDLQAVADFPLLELAFKYGLVEFNTAIKAHAVTYAFDVLGGAKCLSFDNDVWVLRSLWEIEALLDAASVVVAPVAEPTPLDGLRQTDAQIGQAGIFNFGFVAFRDAPGARSRGSSGRHSTGPELAWDRGSLTVRGEPVVFVHFSGVSNFEHYDPSRISRHQTRYRVDDFPPSAPPGGVHAAAPRPPAAVCVQINQSRYRAVPYGYAFFDGGACVVAAARDAYRGATDLDGDAARRRLFARTVRLDNPFNGTPPVLRAAGDGARISVAQWLFEGPYDLPFDLVGAAYVPELAWHAYRSRDGPEAGRPGGRVAATDAAAAAALLAAEPARVWTWFLAYLGDAPGLRKDALLAALCDARVPHAAFDACGRLAPPPGPRVPPFGVTLVVGGARAAVAGALDRDAWPAGAAPGDAVAALSTAAAPPGAFAGCAAPFADDAAPPRRLPRRSSARGAGAAAPGAAVPRLGPRPRRRRARVGDRAPGRDPPLDARGAAGDGDGDAAAGSDADDATLVVDSDTEDDEEAPPPAQDAVLLLESKTPKKRK